MREHLPGHLCQHSLLQVRMVACMSLAYPGMYAGGRCIGGKCRATHWAVAEGCRAALWENMCHLHVRRMRSRACLRKVLWDPSKIIQALHLDALIWLRCQCCLCWRLGSIYLPKEGRAGHTRLRCRQLGVACLAALCQSWRGKVQVCMQWRLACAVGSRACCTALRRGLEAQRELWSARLCVAQWLDQGKQARRGLACCMKIVDITATGCSFLLCLRAVFAEGVA